MLEDLMNRWIIERTPGLFEPLLGLLLRKNLYKEAINLAILPDDPLYLPLLTDQQALGPGSPSQWQRLCSVVERIALIDPPSLNFLRQYIELKIQKWRIIHRFLDDFDKPWRIFAKCGDWHIDDSTNGICGYVFNLYRPLPPRRLLGREPMTNGKDIGFNFTYLTHQFSAFNSLSDNLHFAGFLNLDSISDFNYYGGLHLMMSYAKDIAVVNCDLNDSIVSDLKNDIDNINYIPDRIFFLNGRHWSFLDLRYNPLGMMASDFLSTITQKIDLRATHVTPEYARWLLYKNDFADMSNREVNEWIQGRFRQHIQGSLDERLASLHDLAAFAFGYRTKHFSLALNHPDVELLISSWVDRIRSGHLLSSAECLILSALWSRNLFQSLDHILSSCSEDEPHNFIFQVFDIIELSCMRGGISALPNSMISRIEAWSQGTHQMLRERSTRMLDFCTSNVLTETNQEYFIIPCGQRWSEMEHIDHQNHCKKCLKCERFIMDLMGNALPPALGALAPLCARVQSGLPSGVKLRVGSWERELHIGIDVSIGSHVQTDVFDQTLAFNHFKIVMRGPQDLWMIAVGGQLKDCHSSIVQSLWVNPWQNQPFLASAGESKICVKEGIIELILTYPNPASPSGKPDSRYLAALNRSFLFNETVYALTPDWLRSPRLDPIQLGWSLVDENSEQIQNNEQNN